MDKLDLAFFGRIGIAAITVALVVVVISNRESWMPIAQSLMSRAARGARRVAGMDLVSILVSRYGMDAAGMDDPEDNGSDIDAVKVGMPTFKRDLSDAEWIAWMAVARGKDRKYRFSANTIFAAIGGDRNAVLATIKELRSVPPPASFRQPDGSTAPATYPVTKG